MRTREEKIEMFTRKLDGDTYEAIAKDYGLTRQAVQQMLFISIKEKKPKSLCGLEKYCVYPKLFEFMESKGMSITQLYKKLNFCHSYDVLRNKLKGKSEFSVEDWKQLQKITGMSLDDLMTKKEVEQ